MPSIRSEREGGVARIVISQPARRNAMTYEMLLALDEEFGKAAQDPRVRVVLLRGDGGTFTAGADITQFESLRSSPAGDERFVAAVDRALTSPARCSKPVVCVLNGVCMGGGLELAASCDVRHASRDTLFQMPAARLGAAYRLEGIQRFVALLGPARTADMFFSARRFTAQEAFEIGFVNRVVGDDGLEAQAEEYCRMIAENAPLTIAAAKAAIRASLADPDRRDMDEVRTRIAACFGSHDQREGRRAFLEKRRPRFQGR